MGSIVDNDGNGKDWSEKALMGGEAVIVESEG